MIAIFGAYLMPEDEEECVFSNAFAPCQPGFLTSVIRSACEFSVGEFSCQAHAGAGIF